jgi:hypothetical protein
MKVSADRATTIRYLRFTLQLLEKLHGMCLMDWRETRYHPEHLRPLIFLSFQKRGQRRIDLQRIWLIFR